MLTEAGFVSVPGGQIYFEAAGDPASPALLFIHAGIADHTMWDPQVEFFRGRFRVIRYDTRGYGKTQSDNVPYSDRADAIAVLDHLGVDRAAVIGCSRGGGIALDLALEFPRRVSALTIVCSGPSGYSIWPADSERTRAENALGERMEAARAAKDWGTFADICVWYWVDGVGQPEGRADAGVRQHVRAMCLQNALAHAESAANHPDNARGLALQPPAFGRLGAVAAPTLIIEGDLDEVIIGEMSAAMCDGIANAEHVVFHGAAHVPSMEQPEKFNATLDDFLARRTKAQHE